MRKGATHYMCRESTKLGSVGGPHAQPTLGNPEHVDRVLNRAKKNLRKETVLNKSQEFQVL